MSSFSPIRPNALGNHLNHKTLSIGTRNHGQGPASKTQMLKSPRALLNSYNEPSFNEWCAPLAGNPQWCALLLFMCL